MGKLEAFPSLSEGLNISLPLFVNKVKQNGKVHTIATSEEMQVKTPKVENKSKTGYTCFRKFRHSSVNRQEAAPFISKDAS